MKTLLTGIKPTSQPHIGNYIGAIQPSLDHILTSEVDSYLFIADYHSLTNLHDAELLKQNVFEVACAWLACGLDPNKTTLYRQSHIPELFELYWILSCFTSKGLMSRAHSYKSQVQKNQEEKRKILDHGVSMGLFNYPILMASDILLFQADIVPVGKDQLQHLEMARDIATKFNQCYKTSALKLPQALAHSESRYLLGTDGRKMSKSYQNDIPLFCSSAELKKRIMKIQTDSLPAEAPKDPSSSIAFQIYQAFASEEQSQILKKKLEKGYSHAETKQELFDLLDTRFSDYRKKYKSYFSNPSQVESILEEGAQKARSKAQETLTDIKKIIGLSD